MNYQPDEQRLQGWQWATDRANAASGGKLSVEEYVAARMDEVADSYHAQRLADTQEEPERKALINKLAVLDRSKLAEVEAAIDAANG